MPKIRRLSLLALTPVRNACDPAFPTFMPTDVHVDAQARAHDICSETLRMSKEVLVLFFAIFAPSQA